MTIQGRPVTVTVVAERVEGYDLVGRRYTRPSWRSSVFVQRSSGRGRPWLRFSQKPSGCAPGYWVSAYRTLAEALGIDS